MHSQPEQITVTGCLRNGAVAEDTFVLFSESDTTGTTADKPNFQLMAADTADLRKNVGQHVEVNGTVQSGEQIASSGGKTPEGRASGTSGTPSVQTKTDVDIRRLDVASVKPTGHSCHQ